jgi:hypothetical protein
LVENTICDGWWWLGDVGFSWVNLTYYLNFFCTKENHHIKGYKHTKIATLPEL